MTLIGMLLTALVVAREWERGTMEAILTTKINKIHIVLANTFHIYIRNDIHGFNVFLCIAVFQVPFRGNLLVLAIFSALFLFTAMGQGF